MALSLLFFAVFYTKLQDSTFPSSLPHHYIFCVSSLPAPLSSVFRMWILENGLCVPWLLHGSRAAAQSLQSHCTKALLEDRVTLLYSQTVGHCWRGDCGGGLLNQTCWKGKICEISEHPVMRFPFLQQCQLQQLSAGFFIVPNPSSHDSSKGTTTSICVTMETKWQQQIREKITQAKEGCIFNLDFYSVCSLDDPQENVHQPTCQGYA